MCSGDEVRLQTSVSVSTSFFGRADVAASSELLDAASCRRARGHVIVDAAAARWSGPASAVRRACRFSSEASAARAARRLGQSDARPRPGTSQGPPQAFGRRAFRVLEKPGLSLVTAKPA
jgi:hypothetical protein